MNTSGLYFLLQTPFHYKCLLTAVTFKMQHLNWRPTQSEWLQPLCAGQPAPPTPNSKHSWWRFTYIQIQVLLLLLSRWRPALLATALEELGKALHCPLSVVVDHLWGGRVEYGSNSRRWNYYLNRVILYLYQTRRETLATRKVNRIPLLGIILWAVKD